MTFREFVSEISCWDDLYSLWLSEPRFRGLCEMVTRDELDSRVRDDIYFALGDGGYDWEDVRRALEDIVPRRRLYVREYALKYVADFPRNFEGYKKLFGGFGAKNKIWEKEEEIEKD